MQFSVVWRWLVAAFAVAVVLTLYSWTQVSYDTFPNRLPIGQQYRVGGRLYQVPRLPHTTYQVEGKPRWDVPVPCLRGTLLRDVRALTVDAFAVLRQMQVPFWVTGGSLLGAVLWKHQMCFDDDVDVSILWRDKNRLWSPSLFRLAAARNLEVVVLRGVRRDYAPTRVSSALRLRRKGTDGPVVDVFFLDWDIQQQRWAHVDAWNGTKVTYDRTTEVWEEDWLMPLQERDIDGMVWPLPREPEKMLTKHYGPEWSQMIKSPHPMIRSHMWAFWISSKVLHAWTVLTPEAPGY